MQSLTDLIGEIYEAALNPGHWPDVLRLLCEEVIAAKSAAIMIDDFQLRTRTILGHHGLPRAAVITYNLGLARYDHAFKLQEQQPVGVARQIIDHHEARTLSPMYYRMILKPVDLGYVAGLSIFRTDEWHVGFAAHRGFAAPPFGEQEIGVIQQLYPHLKRAVRIHKEFSRLRARQQTIEDALSHMALGVLEVNADGGILDANEVALRILADHPAVAISDGRLRIADTGQQKLLQELLARMLVAGESCDHEVIGLDHPDAGHPLAVMARRGARVGAVTLYLSDPGLPSDLSLEAMQSVFGFTPAEARVALALVNGLAMRDIAETHGVKEETVKSQLKSLFAKSGVSRQQDLVRVLLKSALPAD